MVYKRWKGKKLRPGDPNYDRARWWMEYRLNGRRIHQAIPEARTKAQAERAEVSEREDLQPAGSVTILAPSALSGLR
ncbi:MAG TPA: hypothetical protein VIG25_21505 [Pyrinomonadaceae bacterium]|jgi:hypothetical protein